LTDIPGGDAHRAVAHSSDALRVDNAPGIGFFKRAD